MAGLHDIKIRDVSPKRISFKIKKSIMDLSFENYPILLCINFYIHPLPQLILEITCS